jgi:hypothetical protein
MENDPIKRLFLKPKKLFFEKLGSHAVLNIEIDVHEDRAYVSANDEAVDRCFVFGPNSESKAIEYVRGLGFSESVDWQLPSQ